MVFILLRKKYPCLYLLNSMYWNFSFSYRLFPLLPANFAWGKNFILGYIFLTMGDRNIYFADRYLMMVHFIIYKDFLRSHDQNVWVCDLELWSCFKNFNLDYIFWFERFKDIWDIEETFLIVTRLFDIMSLNTDLVLRNFYLDYVLGLWYFIFKCP
jgi:hypothetical protein